MRALIAVFAFVPAAACASMGGSADVGLGKVPPAVVRLPDSLRTTPSAVPESTAPMTPAPVPERGARVRVVFPATADRPERQVEGYLYRLEPDRVIMARGLAVDTVPLTGGRQLQNMVRTKGHGMEGAAAGALLGGLVGAVLAAGQSCEGAYYPCSSAGNAMMGGGLGAAAGVLVGGAIGLVVRTDEWGTVPLADARVALGPGGIGLHVAF